MSQTETKPETKTTPTSVGSDGLYNPHTAPFLGDSQDSEGNPIVMSREDALAGALHMVIHAILEIAPQYGNLLDVVKAEVAQAPDTKTFTKSELNQMLNTLASVYVKMVETQANTIKGITDQIPKKELVPSRPPTYIA